MYNVYASFIITQTIIQRIIKENSSLLIRKPILFPSDYLNFLFCYDLLDVVKIIFKNKRLYKGELIADIFVKSTKNLKSINCPGVGCRLFIEVDALASLAQHLYVHALLQQQLHNIKLIAPSAADCIFPAIILALSPGSPPSFHALTYIGVLQKPGEASSNLTPSVGNLPARLAVR